MRLAEVTLDDKYLAERGRIYLTGIQALVRLPMLQQARDAAAGKRTAGYVSGYRGSPLGGYDQQLVAARRFLDRHHVIAQPGVNEDLAATALWGTQQANLHGEGRYDGVFGIWYGKGPGVDRTGDAFRHANLAGTAPLGGVLALMGDDHTCESSTTAHQSEFAMVDAMMPILNPAGVRELIEMGLLGFALSRYSGCWVGFKCVHDTVNTAASIELDPEAFGVVIPDDHELPPGGLNIRWPDHPLEQEARLHLHKLEAVRAFARANRFDRTIVDAPDARLGIVSTGKSFLDLRQALDDLGIDRAAAERLGLRVLKLGLTWPLDPAIVAGFARGLEKILVVEEKRGLIEQQLKEILYGRADAPAIEGKRDRAGAWLFPSNGALSSNQVAVAVAERILELDPNDEIRAALTTLGGRHVREAAIETPAVRLPYFCSGCPHNTSTRVPEGSVAKAGIGCHYMAQWMDRDTAGFTQMGAEGANWIGEAPFSTRDHVFQNIGDGTYYHSGILPIRAAVASGVNITFKILYNDAVAMTGGQKMETGQLDVAKISRQVAAEGAERVVVVSDEPEKYPLNAGFAHGTTVRHRDDLDEVQRELREVEGVSVLIYDQTCAAEKRRRRKRGLMPDPEKRVLINELVCEGCGDCGVQSNCVSIVPLETEYGRKRQIDQSSCNKDFSCLKGFCPSFVTVEGVPLRKPQAVADDGAGPADLPEPEKRPLGKSFGIVVGGVGGTGVVTIGALLGMAAHLEGKGAAGLDMTGLAQKGGAVLSHLRLAPTPDDIRTVRIAPGGADLLLGCDLVVAGGREALGALGGEGHVVVNTQEAVTGDFTRNADFSLPGERIRRQIRDVAGERAHFVDASRIATALMGDSIATNLFMVGVAYQKGLIPLSAEAIERAIELNRVAVDMNRRAFRWGRKAALDPDAVAEAAAPKRAAPPHRVLSKSLEEMVERRAEFLTDYQDAAYAGRYREAVGRAEKVERERVPGESALAEAVARYLFKLMAYKDEYEVARLYTDGSFERRLAEQFEPGGRVKVHLAPPLFADRDPATGRLRKKAYGPWVFRAFRLLARMKGLRGTPLDLFGYQEERRVERRLIADYEARLDEVLSALAPHNHEIAVEMMRVPERIRGFGHVKAASLDEARRHEAELLRAFRAAEVPAAAAE